MVAGRFILFLVLGFLDKNTGICAGTMPYRRYFPATTRIFAFEAERGMNLPANLFLAWPAMGWALGYSASAELGGASTAAEVHQSSLIVPPGEEYNRVREIFTCYNVILLGTNRIFYSLDAVTSPPIPSTHIYPPHSCGAVQWHRPEAITAKKGLAGSSESAEYSGQLPGMQIPCPSWIVRVGQHVSATAPA